LTEQVRRVATALALSSFALTACGGGTTIGSAGSSTPTASNTPNVEPLTCQTVGSAASTHPVYIAKIDNTADSNPQYGIGSADFVTEELVEGGITRLAAFFYSKLPEKVGPIRSGRLTDITLAKPLGANIILSGMAPPTHDGFVRDHITWIDMSNRNVVRNYDHTHDYLHSVEANLKQLGADAKQPSATPKTLLPCGTFTGTRPATKVDVTFSAVRTSHWTYAGGQYTLTNSYMNAGDVFHPNTIVVIKVNTHNASYLDPAGNPVPVSDFFGHGDAFIFAGGKGMKVTWHKKSDETTPTFTDASGNPVMINPGHTWLELIPTSTGVVKAG
jgi:hypothetical protein